MRLTALAFVVACEAAPPPPPPPPPPSFRALATNKQLMAEVLEPAANAYWESVGTVTDKRGTVEKTPRTDDEWAAVRNAATVVAESGNLMMIEPRVVNRGEWLGLARGLVDAGERARSAAVSRSRQAVFDAGAEVYDACVACHSRYMPGVAPPPR